MWLLTVPGLKLCKDTLNSDGLKAVRWMYSSVVPVLIDQVKMVHDNLGGHCDLLEGWYEIISVSL